MIEVRVERGWLHDYWVWRHADRQSRERMPWRIAHQLPGFLREPSFEVNFAGFARREPLRAWWDRVLQEPRPRVLLNLPEPFWRIPWEWWPAHTPRFDASASPVSFIRSVADTAGEWAPNTFAERMLTLIMQGDPDDGYGVRADLAAEAETITGGWRDLDSGVRQRVKCPRVREVANPEQIRDLIRRFRPHVLWFSGHGRGDAVRLLGGQWLAATELATILRQLTDGPDAVRPPLCVVLWACETAAGRSTAAYAVSPAFVEALEPARVAVVLANQSVIRDRSARFMARELFTALAEGEPPDRAVTAARLRLREMRPEGSHLHDFAAPVVWHCCGLAERIDWGTGDGILIDLQSFGRYAIASQGDADAFDVAEAQRVTLARILLARPRVAVVGDDGDLLHRQTWTRTLRVVQSSLKQPVVWVDLQLDDAAEALRDWANRMRNGTFSTLLDSEIKLSLALMAGDTARGWDRLNAARRGLLAVSGRLPGPEAEWFWQAAAGSQGRPLAVYMTPAAAAQFPEWPVEKVDRQLDGGAVDRAVAQAPRLSTAVAVMTAPLPSDAVRVAMVSGEAADFKAWEPAAMDLCVMTAAGPVMTASARRKVLESLDPPRFRLAHEDCALMLHDEVRVPQSAQVVERRLWHWVGAERREEAEQDAAVLFDHLYAAERPVKLVDVVRRLLKKGVRITPESRLIVAWAFLRCGQPREALDWTAGAAISGPLDESRRALLQAEAYKSLGDSGCKERALAAAQTAVQKAKSAVQDAAAASSSLARRHLMACEHDLARIRHYLFYEYQAAADVYGAIIRTWSQDPALRPTLGVVRRNLAECLEAIRLAGEAVESDPLAVIGAAIDDLLSNHERAFALSEAYYTRAKLVENREGPGAAREWYERARDAARKAGNAMMEAVSGSRIFWTYGEFRRDTWHELDRDLGAFPEHGFAVRVRVDGRLRSARRLAQGGAAADAIAILRETAGIMARNPCFDAGSDRRRLALINSGLSVLAGAARMPDPERPWEEFLALTAWARAWVADQGWRTPVDAWESGA